MTSSIVRSVASRNCSTAFVNMTRNDDSSDMRHPTIPTLVAREQVCPRDEDQLERQPCPQCPNRHRAVAERQLVHEHVDVCWKHGDEQRDECPRGQLARARM